MKILYFNYLYDSRQDSVGANVHVNEFVTAMRACGYEIKSVNLNPMPVSTNGKMPISGRIRQVLKKRLKRYVGQLNQVLRNIPLFFREWKILTEEKPDVLLIRYNMLNFSAPIAARLKHIPVVLEVNSPHAYERKNLVKDVWQVPFIPFWIEKLNMKLADKIITVSEPLKQYFVKCRIAEQKIRVIPNGVNTDRFSPDISALFVKQKYNLDGKLVLGFVGSFHYWHGIKNILKLIEFTCAKFQEVVYLLVGDGPLRKKAEEFAKKNCVEDKVIFPGYVPHEAVPTYVAAMDIVLAPYPRMDFFYFSPLKIFEYLSAGKAIVASNVGQISTLIRNGENGLLYEPDELMDFFDKTALLIQNPAIRNRIGENGRQTILQKYSWEQNARKVMDVVNEAMHPKYQNGTHKVTVG
ncbi:MAG: glycosyltransferase family 4 protein [bacterium]